jgi:hypothetical protein
MLPCPVAEYLGAHEAPDLTVATWCNRDFPLARLWGGELEPGPLASGADRCDFRFRLAARLRHLPVDVLKNHNDSIEAT